MENHPETSLEKRLSALAAFLPQFEQPDFTFGDWSRPVTVEPGVMVMSYYTYSATVDAFVEMVYESGWIVVDLDWPTWQNSAEATELQREPDKLAQATPEQLAKLLTVLVRRDRFVEGSLVGAYESGLLTGIVRRASSLTATDG